MTVVHNHDEDGLKHDVSRQVPRGHTRHKREPCTCENRNNTVIMTKEGKCILCGRLVTKNGQWIPKK